MLWLIPSMERAVEISKNMKINKKLEVKRENKAVRLICPYCKTVGMRHITNKGFGCTRYPACKGWRMLSGKIKLPKLGRMHGSYGSKTGG